MTYRAVAGRPMSQRIAGVDGATLELSRFDRHLRTAYPCAVRRISISVALLLAACSQPTAVSLAVSVADGATPSAISLSVYDPHAALLLGRSVATPRLPGTIVLYNLRAGQLRIAGDTDGGREGWASVTVTQGQTVNAALVLSSATSDRDGDGVPDAIDNCPDVANPNQANANGMGPGDACRLLADLGMLDLRAPDLALDLRTSPRDLAGAPDADFNTNGLCPLSGALVCMHRGSSASTTTARSCSPMTCRARASARPR